MPHNSDHIPSIAANVWQGAPQETYWDMYIDDIEFDEAVENYVTNQTAQLESQLGPTSGLTDDDMDTLSGIYNMTKEEMEDLSPNTILNLPITDNPVEKAAYQSDQMNKATLQLMQTGFTIDEAQARASAVVNNPTAMNPWGKSMTLDEMQAVLEVYPGAEEIGNPNSADASELLLMAEKTSDGFEGTVDAYLQAQQDNSFLGSPMDFVKEGAGAIAQQAGETLEGFLASSPLGVIGGTLIDLLEPSPVYAATTDMEFPQTNVTDEVGGDGDDESSWIGNILQGAKEFAVEQLGNVAIRHMEKTANELALHQSLLTGGQGNTAVQMMQAVQDMEERAMLDKSVNDGDIIEFISNGSLYGDILTESVVDGWINTQPQAAQAVLRDAFADAKAEINRQRMSPDGGAGAATIDVPAPPTTPEAISAEAQGTQGPLGGTPNLAWGDWKGMMPHIGDDDNLYEEGPLGGALNLAYNQTNVQDPGAEGTTTVVPQIGSDTQTGAAEAKKDWATETFGTYGGYWTNPDPASGIRTWVPVGDQEGVEPPMLYTGPGEPEGTIEFSDGEYQLHPMTSDLPTKAGTAATGATKAGTPATPTPVDLTIPEQLAMWRDRISEWDVNYSDSFRNIYNKMEGTAGYAAQSMIPDLFRDAEIGYYLERPMSLRDWDPSPTELAAGQTGQAAEEENALWNDYIVSDFFGGAGDFYDRLKGNAESLRDRMWRYKDMSFDEMTSAWTRGESPQVGAAEAKESWLMDPANIRDDIQDRLVFMDPDNDMSRNRLSNLAALYNLPKGSDSWFRRSLQGFFSNMYTNWTAAGNTPEDFLRVFVRGGSGNQPEGLA